MLTRKHFIQVADIIRTHKDRDDLINQFVSYLNHENVRFDEQRFRDACKGDDV